MFQQKGGTLGQAMFVAVQAEPKLQALFVCCVMASVQSAVTRTPFSSSLLVLMLSQGVVVYLFIPVAVAAYVANFVTYKFEVFPQQRQREGKFILFYFILMHFNSNFNFFFFFLIKQKINRSCFCK